MLRKLPMEIVKTVHFFPDLKDSPRISSGAISKHPYSRNRFSYRDAFPQESFVIAKRFLSIQRNND